MKILSVVFITLAMNWNVSLEETNAPEDITIVIENGERVAYDIPGPNNTIWDCTAPVGPCTAIPLR